MKQAILKLGKRQKIYETLRKHWALQILQFVLAKKNTKEITALLNNRKPEKLKTEEEALEKNFLEKRHKRRIQQHADVSESQVGRSYCMQGLCNQILSVIHFHSLLLLNFACGLIQKRVDLNTRK